ncbi:MAG: RNA-guided endonuclease InsQ/TnpB family protein [bacterium]
MILVEKHIIKSNHSFYKECDLLCFKSKNLYNQGLYNIRQYYFENKKYLSYPSNFHITKNQESYSQLPRKVSNQTLRLVDQNFKSFFALLKVEGMFAKMPRYLDKNGRYITKFEKQAISVKSFKKNRTIQLSQTNIEIKTTVKDFSKIKEVRIIPRNKQYVIEVVYEKKEKVLPKSSNVIAAVDVGVNNLATVTLSNGNTPFIINGKPLKSINQFYNKKKGEKQSILKKEHDKYNSNKLIKLTNKRNNKINDYLHKASRLLVNQLVLNNVDTLILGKNINQKQDSNMSKRNNQNFVNIPTFKFLDIVAYKARLEGIEVIWQEESFTSKASFLNLDNIPTYGDNQLRNFSGYRYRRGLYKIRGEKIFINSDVNGSYNILRKAIPRAFSDGIEGFAVNPVLMNICSGVRSNN